MSTLSRFAIGTKKAQSTIDRSNRQGSTEHKEVLNAFGYKTIFTPSSPMKFRGWLFIEELNLGIEASGNDKNTIASILAVRANELKKSVPVREGLFSRIDELIAANFRTRLDGLKYVDSIRPNWRESSNDELKTIVGKLEDLQTERFCEAA